MQVDLNLLSSRASQALEHHELAIAKSRKYRKLLLSPEYLAFDTFISSLPGNYYLSLYDPSICYGAIFTKGFTYTDAPELFDILESLDARFGEPEVNDRPSENYRDYIFRSPTFSLELSVYLEDDAICQRIPIGEEETTRLVEVPVTRTLYAFSC